MASNRKPSARAMARGERSSALRADRERQLLAATRRCISTLGIHGTTVQEVARAAGMAAGSISQYFRGKDRLFTALLRQLSGEFESHWQRRLAAAGDDAGAQLLGFVQSYFDPQLCQREKVAVWFAFWGEVQARPRYQEVCAGFDRRHDAALERLCGRLLAGGKGGRSLSAREAGRAVAALCQGLWLEFLTGADRPTREALGGLAVRGLAALFPDADSFALAGGGVPPRARARRRGAAARLSR